MDSTHSGVWYDPKYNGMGFELHVFDTGRVFGEFFCGSVPDWVPNGPVWFSIQGEPDNKGRVPIYLATGMVFGEKREQKLLPAGHIRFTPDGDTITADVEIRIKPWFSPVPEPAKCTFTLQRIEAE